MNLILAANYHIRMGFKQRYSCETDPKIRKYRLNKSKSEMRLYIKLLSNNYRLQFKESNNIFKRKNSYNWHRSSHMILSKL